MSNSRRRDTADYLVYLPWPSIIIVPEYGHVYILLLWYMHMIGCEWAARLTARMKNRICVIVTVYVHTMNLNGNAHVHYDRP